MVDRTVKVSEENLFALEEMTHQIEKYYIAFKMILDANSSGRYENNKAEILSLLCDYIDGVGQFVSDFNVLTNCIFNGDVINYS